MAKWRKELCHEMELHQKHLPRLRPSCVLSRASPNVLRVADLSATSTVAQEEEHLQLYKKALLHTIPGTPEKQVPQRMSEWET